MLAPRFVSSSSSGSYAIMSGAMITSPFISTKHRFSSSLWKMYWLSLPLYHMVCPSIHSSFAPAHMPPGSPWKMMCLTGGSACSQLSGGAIRIRFSLVASSG